MAAKKKSKRSKAKKKTAAKPRAIRQAAPSSIMRMIAVLADSDPRTVERILEGGKARGMVDRRIRDLLKPSGILDIDWKNPKPESIVLAGIRLSDNMTAAWAKREKKTEAEDIDSSMAEHFSGFRAAGMILPAFGSVYQIEAVWGDGQRRIGLGLASRATADILVDALNRRYTAVDGIAWLAGLARQLGGP